MKVAILNIKLDTSNLKYVHGNFRNINPIYHPDCIFDKLNYDIEEYNDVKIHTLYEDYIGCDISGFTLNHYMLHEGKMDLAYLIGIKLDNKHNVIIPIHNLEIIIEKIDEIVSPYILKDIIREFYSMYLNDERQKKLNYIACL